MTAKKPTNKAHREAVRRFRKECSHVAYRRAQDAALRIAAELHATPNDERPALLAGRLHAELYAFLSEVVEPKVSSDDGIAWAKHCGHSKSGVASGKAQRRGSLKSRVKAFADALHEEEPALRKAEVCRRYISANAADQRSTSSVTRYVAGLW